MCSQLSTYLFIPVVRGVSNVSIEASPGYLCSCHEVLDLFLLAWHRELQNDDSRGRAQSSAARKRGRRRKKPLSEHRRELFVPILSRLSKSQQSLAIRLQFTPNHTSLTFVCHNHKVPFYVIARHFPASSNCDASLHLSSFSPQRVPPPPSYQRGL